ncbi:hypothetical protein D3C75_865760 [compost metagenome]
MGVDEAGGDQRIGPVAHLDRRRQARQQFGRRTQGANATLLDQQQAVLEMAVGGGDPDAGGIVQAVEQGGAIGLGSSRHGDGLPCERGHGVVVARGYACNQYRGALSDRCKRRLVILRRRNCPGFHPGVLTINVQAGYVLLWRLANEALRCWDTDRSDPAADGLHPFGG